MLTATPEATKRFAEQFSHLKHFYSEIDGLLLSRLGLGTYVKEPYKEENYLFSYKDAVKKAVQSGVNVIDTAINYRYQQSEKEIGEALKELFSEGVSRESLFISSKGGFIPLDFPFPKNPYHWIRDNIIKKGLAKEEEIILDQHCFSPKYIEYSCHQSLENLGIETLDLYFLHNPEMQLGYITYTELLDRLEAAFVTLEKLVEEGKIRYYGIASWNAFLYEQENMEHISLEDVLKRAEKAAGGNSHLRFIQVPFNLAKTQAYISPTQKIGNENVTLIQAAKRLGIAVMTSSSLLQMNLFKRPFKAEMGVVLDKEMRLTSDIQLALQFVRSHQGIVTSLFGTKNSEHVEMNIKVGK